MWWWIMKETDGIYSMRGLNHVIDNEGDWWCLVRCSLQGINALCLMDIKSCISFTKLGTVVLNLGFFVMGKNTPQLKFSWVKWWNNITSSNFSYFFFFSTSIFIIYWFIQYFPSRNVCTEFQFRGKNYWIWVYPPIV